MKGVVHQIVAEDFLKLHFELSQSHVCQEFPCRNNVNDLSSIYRQRGAWWWWWYWYWCGGGVVCVWGGRGVSEGVRTLK